ncbi:uncharacterized protein RJT21DRAFT_44452 [Scheffersomyces amazonensis]|uniref:uncharacterized protein n=1 Tax=Scheffersomyces amazonensis TaxID=1078765 RepID=UPI00315CAAF8
MSATPEYVINISSSDENEDDENDLQIIEEFRKETQDLLDNPTQQPQHEITKKLTDIQCPICFDTMTEATATSCGHMFCLDCIQQSISSSHARGQANRRGMGLCPLCRKKVSFKDTIVLRLKVSTKLGIPTLPPLPPDKDSILINDLNLESGKPITNDNKNDNDNKINEKKDKGNENSPDTNKSIQVNSEIQSERKHSIRSPTSKPLKKRAKKT